MDTSAMGGDGPTGPLLCETGTVYVTLAAARSALAEWGGGEEHARRRLTEVLLDARAVDRTVSPEQWRARQRSTGVDVTARIVREGRLAVVVSCSVRPLSRGVGR